MKDLNKEHNKLMDILQSVPGVTEHMNSKEVILGLDILKRRLELGWTQSQLVEICNLKGVSINKEILCDIELGMKSVEVAVYENVVEVLDCYM